MTGRLRQHLPWLIFVLWLCLQGWALYSEQGLTPLDFLTYRRAAEAIGRGAGPFLTPAQTQDVWRYFHRTDHAIRAADARGAGEHEFLVQAAQPEHPGPYLYPPTLALLILQLHISAPIFEAVSLLCIFGFAWLWLRNTGADRGWLLLIVGSWDIWAYWTSGNAEIIVLFATLLAAWLLWTRRAVPAALCMALVLLIKPYYALFFVVFAALYLFNAGAPRRVSVRTLLGSGAVTLALLAAEAYRWGPMLRAATWRYFTNALSYQSFALPAAEQTPVSAWNRTPLQALVSAGMPASTAEAVALALWLLLVALTAWRVSGVRLTFPAAFALAFILLYWGRPIGWTFAYLDLIVLTLVWPHLRRWGRTILLGVVVAIAASHWAALILTLGGHGLQLLTLQSANFPWETWTIVPLSWLLVLRAVPSRADHASIWHKARMHAQAAGEAG